MAKLTEQPKPDPYQCSWCLQWWPVRVLARECERKHEAETNGRAVE